jgi:hypothetical protein
MAVTLIKHVIYKIQHRSRVTMIVVIVYTLTPYMRATWNKYFEKGAGNSEGRRSHDNGPFSLSRILNITLSLIRF